MILYKDKYSSSNDASYTLHWLPIIDRILYKILCLAFNLGPSYLNEMFIQNVSQRRLRSNSTNEITYIVLQNNKRLLEIDILVLVDHMSGIISQVKSIV